MAETLGERGAKTVKVVDYSSVALLAIGIGFGAWSIVLIATQGSSPLILIPSLIAAAIGATNIIKQQAVLPTTKDEQ